MLIRLLLCVVAAALLGSAGLAAAGETALPSDLRKILKPLKVQSAGITQGVFRVVMAVPMVNQDMYRNIVFSACAEVFMSQSPAKAWGRKNITRIEVLNDIAAQGFAFAGGRKACNELGTISGGPDNEKQYIASYTWVCVAGNPCRPRRDGEQTSGDD